MTVRALERARHELKKIDSAAQGTHGKRWRYHQSSCGCSTFMAKIARVLFNRGQRWSIDILSMTITAYYYISLVSEREITRSQPSGVDGAACRKTVASLLSVRTTPGEIEAFPGVVFFVAHAARARGSDGHQNVCDRSAIFKL